MKLIRITPFVLLLLVSCAKQKEETRTAETDTLVSAEIDPAETVRPELPDPTDSLLIEYKNFLWDLDKSDPYSVRVATEKYAELFRGKPNALGDTAIYWFEKLYAAVTNRLDERHQNNPERYDSLLDEEVKHSAFLIGYRDSLVASGHRIAVEEGGSYIEQDRAFMEDAFYPYVSPAMVEFLKQVHRENEEGFGSDGGLSIEPETLATRIGWWEEFYVTNPNFIFQYGRQWKKTYINVLMTGTDNTPHYWDAEAGKKPALDEYYVKAYTHLFTRYPKSKATGLLRPYYDLLVVYDTTRAKRYRQMNWRE